MSKHPNKKIDWLHHLFVGDFVKAATMLFDLAMETNSIQKRKVNEEIYKEKEEIIKKKQNQIKNKIKNNLKKK